MKERITPITFGTSSVMVSINQWRNIEDNVVDINKPSFLTLCAVSLLENASQT